ncbi:carboxymuconolactone decarboxylase family protein [Dialister sp.]|uniref:carboxymuconolactone decarboxylase family protein n=1 Tax=Dialister sp. TaxID=1955814 RepID=UPI003F11F403
MTLTKKALLTAAAVLMFLGTGVEAFAEAPEGDKPMTKKIVQTAGRDVLGKTAPDFARYNDDILFGEVWNKQDALSVKQRCMITVVALVSQGMTDSSLKYHIQNAKNNGVTLEEMADTITQTAFYAGWPKAWAAFRMVKEVYEVKD